MLFIFLTKDYYHRVNKTQFREISEKVKERNVLKSKVVSSWGWHFDYFFNRGKDKMKVIDKPMPFQDYIKELMANPENEPFWYIAAHFQPYNLTPEAEKFLTERYNVVENIEVVSNQDDGIEFFGGTVNAKNLLVWNSGDDAIDTDQAWSGTIDNFIVICGEATDHALEVDGPEGSLLASHTIKNGSVKGAVNSEMADFRDGARAAVQNVYFFNFPNPNLPVDKPAGRGDLSLSNQDTKPTFTGGFLTFSNIQATLEDGLVVGDAFKGGSKDFASLVTLKENTVGADKSVFASWTWADAAGQLADFK